MLSLHFLVESWLADPRTSLMPFLGCEWRSGNQEREPAVQRVLRTARTVVLVLALAASQSLLAQETGPPIGIFESHGDVGSLLHPGSVAFDRATGAYTVAGSGENLWFDRDAFHFVWKRASGDVVMMADVAFLGAGTDPHRKACLMFRQSLDADSAYVDLAIHGVGLTSLQFREARGAATHEVQANLTAPRRLRIEKRGRYALIFLAAEGRDPEYSGAAVRVALESPFYLGIGVCSHNKDVTERAVFSNVEMTSPLPPPSGRPVLYSTLES